MLQSEVAALDRVVDTLASSFPTVAEEDIRRAVARASERFADASVRSYVPVLVLRQVRAELMRIAAGEEPVASPAVVG